MPYARLRRSFEERSIPQVLAAERHQIEGVELCLAVVLVRMQGVEIGDALDVEHADFTVDDELALLDLQRRFDDPGKAPGLVQPAPGEQFDVLAVADDTPAVAIVFYLVDPVGAARDHLR